MYATFGAAANLLERVLIESALMCVGVQGRECLKCALHLCVMLICCAFSFVIVLSARIQRFFADLCLGLGDVQAFGVGGRLLRPRVMLRRI